MDVDIIARGGAYQVRCTRSTSGLLSLEFCRYCQNDCAFAGKSIDELRSMCKRGD